MGCEKLGWEPDVAERGAGVTEIGLRGKRKFCRFRSTHNKVSWFFQLSSWTLILLTSERLISVWMPFKCKELCSRRRIVVTWIAMLTLLFGTNMHFFFTTDIIKTANQPAYCGVYLQFWDFFLGAWYWIDAILGDLIPFLVVFTGNCVIVTKLIASHRQRTHEMHVAESEARTVSCWRFYYVSL